MPKTKRYPIQIIVDLLRAASGSGATVSTLVNRSNTNFIRASRYVELLVQRSLLEAIGCHPRIYRTTARGDEAAKILSTAEELIFGPIRGEKVSRVVLFEPSSKIALTPQTPFLMSSIAAFGVLGRSCRLRDQDGCRLVGLQCQFEACPFFGSNAVQNSGLPRETVSSRRLAEYR